MLCSKILLRTRITHCSESCFVHDYISSLKLDGSSIEIGLISKILASSGTFSDATISDKESIMEIPLGELRDTLAKGLCSTLLFCSFVLFYVIVIMKALIYFYQVCGLNLEDRPKPYYKCKCVPSDTKSHVIFLSFVYFFVCVCNAELLKKKDMYIYLVFTFNK